MGVRGWLLALVFFTLVPASARAIDCSSVPEGSRHGYAYADLVCASAELAELAVEIGRLEHRLGAAMQPAARKILVMEMSGWREGSPFCRGSLAECIAAQRERMRSRVRFLQGAPESGSGTGEEVAILPLLSKLTNAGRPAPNLVQRFADPRTPGTRAYNAIVDAIIARNRQTTGEEANYLLHSLRVAYASARLMSVEHQYAYMQTEGGHDPVDGISNFNIDMQRGKLVDLADIFPPDRLAEMQNSCVEQLVGQIARRRAANENGDAASSPQQAPEVSAWMSGLFGTAESWSFRETGAVVTFDPETMGVPGELNCRFSAGDIRRNARADAPVP